MSVRLLIVGAGFFPRVMAGDKNFFAQLVPLLARGCESIDVLSINDSVGCQHEEMNGCHVTYHNVGRALHLGDRSRFFAGHGSLLDYQHKHKALQEMCEILLTTIRQIPRLKQIVRDRQVEAVHFMDNMGPSMLLVRKVLRGPMVTHSAMGYDPRSRFYKRYLLLSMGALDKIIAYSEAYARKLQEMGIDAKRIEVIRWGVEPERGELNGERKAQIRAAYGVPLNARFLLWSGFIQQIRERDFRAAVEVARRVTEVRPHCRFVFAFKPTSFRSEFKALESEAVRIETDVEHFADLVGAADFLYSPLLALDTIVAPPLTWLEAMSAGTPVISTAAGGVEEVIEHGATGFVAQSFEDVADVVVEAVDCTGLDAMSRKCRSFIAANCDIRAVADRYLYVWRGG